MPGPPPAAGAALPGAAPPDPFCEASRGVGQVSCQKGGGALQLTRSPVAALPQALRRLRPLPLLPSTARRVLPRPFPLPSELRSALRGEDAKPSVLSFCLLQAADGDAREKAAGDENASAAGEEVTREGTAAESNGEGAAQAEETPAGEAPEAPGSVGAKRQRDEEGGADDQGNDAEEGAEAKRARAAESEAEGEAEATKAS